MPIRKRVASLLLKTGQTTQYSSKLDDGYYQQGRSTSYVVYTTGQYAGTTNIDLLHATSAAGDISFNNNNPAADTITSAVLDFTTFLVATDVIVISGATDAGNNAAWTIAGGGVAANTITLTQSNVLTTRAPDALAINFAKREAHSNACVLDNNTGLLWSRTQETKMGATSNGQMPWYDATKVFDIFTYCAQCNTAALAGYTDWRVPNILELQSIMIRENAKGTPDSTAFASWGAFIVWSSTTYKQTTTKALAIDFSFDGTIASATKSTGNYARAVLVRG